MGTYLRPCGDVWISSSWADHHARNPPSKEPGTDYAVPHDTPVRAVTNGVISEVKHDTSGAMGRVVGMRHDDGNYTRHLHLRSIPVGVGHRVARGDIIGYSGGSAWGSETGVGAHVHTTFWLGSPWVTPTVDFELYVGNEEEDDMFTDDDRANILFIKEQLGGSSARTTSLRTDVDELAKTIPANVWNYPIGEGGESGVSNQPAWRRLSFAHSDTARLVKRIGGSITGTYTTVTQFLERLVTKTGA